MNTFEKLNSDKFKLSTTEMNKAIGGRRDNPNTIQRESIYTNASERCPCGDIKYEITYDGPWSAYMKDHCTLSECLDCEDLIAHNY